LVEFVEVVLLAKQGLTEKWVVKCQVYCRRCRRRRRRVKLLHEVIQ